MRDTKYRLTCAYYLGKLVWVRYILYKFDYHGANHFGDTQWKHKDSPRCQDVC